VRRNRRLRIRGTGYRLRFRLGVRVSWTALLLFSIAFLVPVVGASALDLWWHLLGITGIVSALAGLRVMWGSAIVVGPEGMRVYKPWWPLHRDFAWYRILATDIIPGFWFLEIEMNSGERIELPCVEHMDELYERIEDYRRQILAARPSQ
jgi:hypothetical protein